MLSSDNPICLAPAHFMDITQLQSDEHQLGFTGVDYGFRTLATSVPMKEEQAKYHLDMLTSDHPPERFIRLPKAITLKSETIFDSTGERERRRKLEYKKQNVSVVIEFIHACSNFALDYTRKGCHGGRKSSIRMLYEKGSDSISDKRR